MRVVSSRVKPRARDPGGGARTAWNATSYLGDLAAVALAYVLGFVVLVCLEGSASANWFCSTP